ncbi:MAG: hypothetical protein V1684_02510 [bacterium]
MLNSENIKLVRPLKWEEVFSFWYQNEGDKENWINLAKERGFASWADWRLTGYAIPFECAKAGWGLYEISNPLQVVPQFYGGPFRGWTENYYGGAKEKTFKELAVLPEIINHSFIQRAKNDFPVDKIITCLEVGGKVYTVEGMHRCCTLAIMAQENNNFNKILLFAIGESPLKELPLIGRNDKK